MSWYLRLLGGLRLEQNGVPLQGKAAHRRRLAVLALLASSPTRSMTRDRIIAHLWPEVDTDGGRKLLSESVYVLRRTIGEDALQNVGAELLLNRSRVRTDLDELEAALHRMDMAAAATAYAGPFLDGWHVNDAPEFERWVDQQRDQIHRTYLEALEAAAAERERIGDWKGATVQWRAATSVDPYSSRLALRLAQALASSGEPGAAAQVLALHTQRLQSELQVEPSADVLAMIGMLRERGSSSFDRATPVAGGLASTREPPPPAPAIDDEARPAEPTVPADTGLPAAEPSPSHTSRIRSSGGWKTTAWGAGLAAMLAVVMVSWSDRRASAQPEAVAEPQRVAVLYLDAAGDSNDLRFLAEELSTEVINDLSSNGFRLVSASASRAVRDGRLPLDSLIASDSVGTLVEGSLRRADERVEATVRITDARSGEQIATGSFAHPVTDWFTLERELSLFVTRQLAQHFRRTLSAREADSEERDPVARKLLVLAQRRREDAAVMVAQGHRFDLESAREALVEADSLLDRALRLEARWPRALVEAGFIARERGRLAQGAERRRLYDEGLRRAEAALQREANHAGALELRGTIRWSLITSLTGGSADTAALALAERDLQRSVELEPGRATAWMTLSYVQAVRGKPAAARIAAARALENNAYLAESQDLYFGLFASALTSDSLQAASRWCARGYRAFPADVRFTECELTLLRERPFQTGDDARAWLLVARLDSLDRHKPRSGKYPPTYRRMVAAAVSAKAGDSVRAKAVVAASRKAVVGSRELELDLAFDEAAVHLALGDEAGAIRLLNEVVAARPLMARVIERAPLFRGLRISGLRATPGRE